MGLYFKPEECHDVINLAESGLLFEYESLLQIGLNPILLKDSKYGVDLMVDQLIGRVKKEGNINLLRIHGHGFSGTQTVSTKIQQSNAGEILPMPIRSFISNSNFEIIQKCLERLKGSFNPNAQVWLMGCNVGENPHGPVLLNKLAKLWSVTVKAGTGLQFGGGTDTFGIEGTIITVTA